MRFLCAFACVALALVPVGAHDSLYHYAEVILIPGKPEVGVAFSIHIGDLASARALGAEPTATSLECLRGRSLAEVAAVEREAMQWIEKAVRLEVAEASGRASPWVFPDAAEISKNPERFEGARPGFLVAMATVSAGDRGSTLNYAAHAGKRLLLVIPRPGRFPLVKDLPPGSSEILPPPSSSPNP